MQTRSLIYRILITVGVILSAPGSGFAQTNGDRDPGDSQEVGTGSIPNGKFDVKGAPGVLPIKSL